MTNELNKQLEEPVAFRFVVINQQAPTSVQLAKINKNRCERVRIPESFIVEDIILRSSCLWI